MPNILVVDDEPVIGMLLQEWLSDLHHDTIGPAASVNEALDCMAVTPPDAAILDVSLGNDDCYSIADILRARGVRMVFATGRDARSLDARFSDEIVLNKPFSFENLKVALEKLFEHS
jgi:CheY-like chemotaxis protein